MKNIQQFIQFLNIIRILHDFDKRYRRIFCFVASWAQSYITCMFF